MNWITLLLSPNVIWVLIPIVAIIGIFSVLGAKVYFAHVERMGKIRNGIDPDASDEDS